MLRREFLEFMILGAVPGTGLSLSSRNETILSQLVSANDSRIPGLLKRQERRSSHRWFGGWLDDYGIHSAGGTSHFIQALTAAFASPDSAYFRSTELAGRLIDAVRYLSVAQHQDGTIDLHTTNFHSPPDTAFAVEPLGASYFVLKKLQEPSLHRCVEGLTRFLKAAGEALVMGGVHTPNHRWVVCSALARLHSFFQDTRYLARIEEWLAEGIDIDPDGQYTEKSTAIYSAICNKSLLTMARLLNNEDLLEPVRQNLEMTVYYAHPDGELVTQASGRQDRNQRGSLRGYYIPYRFLALKDHNPVFAAMTRLIEGQKVAALASDLIYFLELPLLSQQLPVAAELPSRYVKHFRHSELIRIRRDRASATIFGSNSTLLSLHKGRAVLEAIRLASAFFGKGQFRSQSLEVDDQGIVLTQELNGPYFQPLPREFRRADGRWIHEDRARRTQSEVQKLNSKVVIQEQGGHFQLLIEIEGVEGVPVALELGFRRGGELEGVEPVEGVGEAFFLKKGTGEYRHGEDVIRFGPGFHAHRWTQLRGAAPKLDAVSVYLTGFTPFLLNLEIG